MFLHDAPSPEVLRQAHEEAAPGAELRREYADARAVADLVDVVECVDHVEADLDRPARRIVEPMAYREVDLRIAGKLRPVGNLRQHRAVRLHNRRGQWLARAQPA